MVLKKILYYLDCYYRMTDYDETLSKIVSDFITDETNDSVQELVKQCKAILTLPEEERITVMQHIIKKASDLDIGVNELESILEETIDLICTHL